MAEAKTNYLAKLLTLLVKREGGAIRIPIQDLMIDDIGQGISVHFAQETKELVITYVPAGSTIYKIEGATTWLTNQSLPQNKSEGSRPLTQDELVAKVWTESAATPTESELRQPPNLKKNKVVVLSDETMAQAELEKRKREVLREIENYSSPQPRVAPSRPLTTFSKQ